MSQEARGLDAGQRLVSRLLGSQDKRSAAIVERISQVCAALPPLFDRVHRRHYLE